ncbi:MAG TPA: nucleoside deaminase [Longimicrobium sp.]
MSQIDHLLLSQAIDAAETALSLGETPFAALIADADTVLGVFKNGTAQGDPTAHAEIVAIRETCAAYEAEMLRRCTIYCSCEPCPMCTAAIFYAGIPRIVYAAPIEEARAFGSGDPPLKATQLSDLGCMQLEILSGGMSDRVVELFKRRKDSHGEL